MIDLIKQLDNFFEPDSVAVIGASGTPGKIGYEVLRSLATGGYQGKIYPITLSSTKILNLPCYKDIMDAPDTIDLAVFIIPSKIITPILENCGKKGIRNVIIISAGFKEMGDTFAQIQKDVTHIAQKYSIRIIGPNCIGVYDSTTKLDTFFQPIERMLRPKPGPVALLSQSGAVGLTILELIAESNFGISKFVSYGNRVDVSESDLLTYFEADPLTKIIAVYIEGLEDGREFIKTAKKVAQKKPIIVLKTGKTNLGAEGALSHTGSLAGSYEVYKAAFKQANLIVADTIIEMFDMIKALSTQPPAQGRNIGMTSNGMGPCISALDLCYQRNIQVGNYSPTTVKELKEKLPGYCMVRKVVDLSGSATSRDYAVTLKAFIKDPKINLVMPFFIFQDAPLDEDIINVIIDIKEEGKPIICSASGGPYTRQQVEKIEKEGVPFYTTPEGAVSAAYALIKAGEI